MPSTHTSPWNEDKDWALLDAGNSTPGRGPIAGEGTGPRKDQFLHNTLSARRYVIVQGSPGAHDRSGTQDRRGRPHRIRAGERPVRFEVLRNSTGSVPNASLAMLLDGATFMMRCLHQRDQSTVGNGATSRSGTPPNARGILRPPRRGTGFRRLSPGGVENPGRERDSGSGRWSHFTTWNFFSTMVN